MTRGRKPKPTRLKLVQGTPGKRPLPADEPEPDVGLPPAPAHLSDAAKAEWDNIGGQLLELGLVTNIDAAALAVYCTAFARWAEAEEKLREFGMITKTPNGGLAQSPYLSIANRAMEQMMKALLEFGMSPSSRTRVKAAKAPAAADPLEKYTT